MIDQEDTMRSILLAAVACLLLAGCGTMGTVPRWECVALGAKPGNCRKWEADAAHQRAVAAYYAPAAVAARRAKNAAQWAQEQQAAEDRQEAAEAKAAAQQKIDAAYDAKLRAYEAAHPRWVARQYCTSAVAQDVVSAEAHRQLGWTQISPLTVETDQGIIDSPTLDLPTRLMTKEDLRLVRQIYAEPPTSLWRARLWAFQTCREDLAPKGAVPPPPPPGPTPDNPAGAWLHN